MKYQERRQIQKNVPIMLKKRTVLLIVKSAHSLTHTLSVVRCALSNPEENSDWKHTNMFHTFAKIGGKICKVVVNNGSCINAISSTVIDKIGLKVLPHTQSYKVSWINATTQEVTKRHLVPIDFNVYKDKLRCDIIATDMDQAVQQ